MKRIRLALAFAFLTAGAGFGQPGTQNGTDQNHGKEQSIQNLMRQVQALEARIEFIQKRMSDLESRSCSKPPLVPLPALPMPPGARSFQFNGMEFWSVPVQKPGQSQDSRRPVWIRK